MSIQCEKVQRPEKQVLKKLKLVHIQVEKKKLEHRHLMLLLNLK